MAYFKRFNTGGRRLARIGLSCQTCVDGSPGQGVIPLASRPATQECLLMIRMWVRARGWLRSLDFRFGLDGHQLDFEDEGSVGTDAATRAAARAIGKLRWNKKLPL